jgi:hypothetical protein
MPAPCDIASMESFYRTDTDFLQMRAKASKEKYDLTRESKHADNLRKFDNMIEQSESRLSFLKGRTSGNKGIGKLMYGSGFKEGCDWALCNFSDRDIVLKPPPEKDIRKAIIRDGPDEILLHDDPDLNKTWAALRFLQTDVLEFAKPQVGSAVLKCGRTTALTLGQINRIESELYISGLSSGSAAILKKAPEDWHDNENLAKFKLTAIVPPQAGNRFARAGDSGAWVLNMGMNGSTTWVGSIIAVHDSGQSRHITLVLSADSIVNDIQRFTGGRVVSPKRGLDLVPAVIPAAKKGAEAR